MSCDRIYTFAGSLQPTDAQDDSNIALSYSSTQSLLLCVDLRVLLLAFANKALDRQGLNYIPTSCLRARFIFLVTFLNLALKIGQHSI